MKENKLIMIDELKCNICPDKKRCDEQRERKDKIINSMLDDIKDTAIAYHCDLKDKIKILKQNLPIITRCDVVLEKQLARKTQEYNELREYHNKCCSEFENKKKELLEKYNQLSRDFYSGKYCNVEKCKQLYRLKSSKEQAEQKLIRIKQVCEEYCEQMCLCDSRETCKDCINTEVFQIIKEEI